MKKLIAGLAIAVTATSASALSFSDKDRAFIAGVGTVLLWQHATKDRPVERATPGSIYVSPHVVQPIHNEYYNCMVTVYDYRTGQARNEVRTCVRQHY